MTTAFASRLRSGMVVGVIIALGIVAMDMVLGKWDALVMSRMITLGITILVAAFAWAWLTGRAKPEAADTDDA